MDSATANLPPRQREVVRLILELTQEHGYPPTLAELARALGLKNRMTVHQHVVALKKKGIVRWEQGLNRSLRVSEGIDPEQLGLNHAYLPAGILEDSSSTRSGFVKVGDIDPEISENVRSFERRPGAIPLLGRIAAGTPIDAVASDEYLEVESQYGESGCFALRVKGESMIEDGIFDGDYVIVKPKPSPTNGEVVVALLEDGTTTLKRFFKEKNRFRLQPANSEMAPIYVDSLNDMQIQGVVVALFRKML